MATTLSRKARRLITAGLVLATAGTTLAAALPAGAQAGTSPHPQHSSHYKSIGRAPVTAGSDYLALGDSVSFGYREPSNLPTPNYPDAASFVGFPENIASELHVHVANASCPGETSASLIDNTAPSYACETPTGYRTNFPLHVKYSGSQLAFGVHYLRTHPHTRLVSLMIGANDAFLCQATTTDGCASELPGVLAKIKANVSTILKTLRGAGHYRGQIVVVNYYSTDYTSPTASASSQALNQAMDAGGKPYTVRIADGYAAFQKAAAQAGGDTCKAGLLTFTTPGPCGVHPSIGGQEILAGTVERVVSTR